MHLIASAQQLVRDGVQRGRKTAVFFFLRREALVERSLECGLDARDQRLHARRAPARPAAGGQRRGDGRAPPSCESACINWEGTVRANGDPFARGSERRTHGTREWIAKRGFAALHRCIVYTHMDAARLGSGERGRAQQPRRPAPRKLLLYHGTIRTVLSTPIGRASKLRKGQLSKPVSSRLPRSQPPPPQGGRPATRSTQRARPARAPDKTSFGVSR